MNLIDLIQRIFHLGDYSSDKLGGATRSPLWYQTKKEFEKLHPKICPICGTKKKIELHHILIFYKFPELENDLNNLIWLCRRHHLEWGHFYNFSSWNEDIKKMVQEWQEKVEKRP